MTITYGRTLRFSNIAQIVTVEVGGYNTPEEAAKAVREIADEMKWTPPKWWQWWRWNDTRHL